MVINFPGNEPTEEQKELSMKSLTQQLALAVNFFDHYHRIEELHERFATVASLIMTVAEEELAEFKEGKTEEQIKAFAREFAFFNQNVIFGLASLSGYESPTDYVADLFEQEEE